MDRTAPFPQEAAPMHPSLSELVRFVSDPAPQVTESSGHWVQSGWCPRFVLEGQVSFGWKEDEHPRDHGKFAEKGAGAPAEHQDAPKSEQAPKAPGKSPEKAPDPTNTSAARANTMKGGGDKPMNSKTEGGKMKVQVWRGHDFSRPVEQTSEELAAWVKPGNVIVEERDGPRHKTFDTSSPVTMRSRKIGAELPEGTVKAKRMIHDPQGGVRIEYLVKPRNESEAAKYAAASELEWLETLLVIDPDARTEHLQQIRDKIQSLKSQLSPPATSVKQLPPAVAAEQKPPQSPPPSPGKPVAQPPAPAKPKELTGVELLKGQLKTLRGLIDMGRGPLADYVRRADDLEKQIAASGSAKSVRYIP